MKNAELELVIAVVEKASGPLNKIASAQEAAAILASVEKIIAGVRKGVGGEKK